MRKRIKELLLEKETLCGCFIQTPSPEIVEMARKYDYVILDYEHGHITRDRLTDMVRAAEAADLAVMVRIPEVDPVAINKGNTAQKNEPTTGEYDILEAWINR